MPSSIELRLKTELFRNRFKYKQNHRKTTDKIIVKTEYGLLEGIKRISVWKKPFYSFEKVPFAKPPVGLLRFRDPIPPEAWNGVLDCTKEADMPVQWNKLFQHVEGSEDCLYLSIYTANTQPKSLYPVLAWIPGGDYETGSTSKMFYAPDYFMDKEVVLVLIAYRLSIFGFISLKDPIFGIPGNAGLRDQIMALKWIKSNISAFGGNPHNVTVFGHSAGAASINFLMMSDQARDLFHKAILLSGSAHCFWAHQPLVNNWTDQLLGLMGNKSSMHECQILEFLERANTHDIMSNMSKILNSNEIHKKIFIPTGPVIEPYIGPNCVISKHPKLMANDAWGNHIPVILGGNSLEGLVMYPDLQKDEVEELDNCEHLIPFELEIDPNSNRRAVYGQLIRRTYFGNDAPTLPEYVKLLSHKVFWHGIRRMYLARMKYARESTYLYRFDFDSPTFNHHRVLHCGKNVRGVSHCDVLSYLFYNALADDIPQHVPEFKMIKLMTAMCTQFAFNGNPNNIEWYPLLWKPAVNKVNARILCLNISNNLSIIDLPENRALDMWDSMYSATQFV